MSPTAAMLMVDVPPESDVRGCGAASTGFGMSAGSGTAVIESVVVQAVRDSRMVAMRLV